MNQLKSFQGIHGKVLEEVFTTWICYVKHESSNVCILFTLATTRPSAETIIYYFFLRSHVWR